MSSKVKVAPDCQEMNDTVDGLNLSDELRLIPPNGAAAERVSVSNRESDNRASRAFQLPDWVEAHRKLKHKGVTKHLLWEEYTQAYPNLRQEW